jgi:hypothetical protein
MFQELMDRRKHPDYSSITAYLPKDKIRRLKAIAALNDLTLSEAVEAAADVWMDSIQKNVPFEDES